MASGPAAAEELLGEVGVGDALGMNRLLQGSSSSKNGVAVSGRQGRRCGWGAAVLTWRGREVRRGHGHQIRRWLLDLDRICRVVRDVRSSGGGSVKDLHGQLLRKRELRVRGK
ncbi:hypothetical protein CFC21_082609 [Triticum aestivum]|uniref:Uncharacterized protein n=2 Tax=Triticum aestivum TaxID=4565 RepID=A0A9R1I6V6_WHEAT|nr:hypothetical protein CFC21_082609 [Triticum aestivum]